MLVISIMSKKIQLNGHTRRSPIRGYAIVDDGDFERVNSRNWSLSTFGYVVAGRPQIKLHRFIMNPPEGMQIDHINGDKLDNRRENLRICTRDENLRNKGLVKKNTSGYKGLCWFPSMKKWQVRIRCNGEKLYLGYFADKKEAARVYNEAAIKCHGKFARLNKLD
jgi:AP2 domain./HNH endonuclease.